MRIKTAIVAAFMLATGLTHTAMAKPMVFANEKPIEFKANSGDTTDAYEGFLYVPENRNAKDSRDIRINYVRFPATGKNKGAPIVYLSGGPGGSGIGTAKWRRFPLFMAMREFGDVIALDQRGTGASEQAEPCTSSVTIPLNQKLQKSQVRTSYRKAAKECLSKWQQQGIDVYGYTTEQNAWDIDALRQHLKADKVSLWGISYGSHLALAAMKQFPNNIDKVIIASAEGLNQTVKLPAMTDRYFAEVQKVIDQQSLKQMVSDLPALMRRVHAKLDTDPILLSIPNKDGSSTDILFQTHLMQALASRMIADPGQYLAMLIHVYLGLDNGNTDLLMHILQRGMFNNEPLNFRLMSLAMDVASGITEERLKLVQQQAQNSLLSDMLNFPMPMLDKLDAKLDLGDGFRADVQSDIPTLLLTGTLDGRTYPAEQIQAVSGLSNVTQVKVVYAGHNLYTTSPEVLERMQAFMAGQPVSTANIELALPDLSMNR